MILTTDFLSQNIYLQGEELRSKADMIDDTVLLSMFKEQEGEGGRGGRSHSHSHQSNNWQEINGFHLQNSTSFSEYHHHHHHHHHHKTVISCLIVRFQSLSGRSERDPAIHHHW